MCLGDLVTNRADHLIDGQGECNSVPFVLKMQFFVKFLEDGAYYVLFQTMSIISLLISDNPRKSYNVIFGPFSQDDGARYPEFLQSERLRFLTEIDYYTYQFKPNSATLSGISVRPLSLIST